MEREKYYHHHTKPHHHHNTTTTNHNTKPENRANLDDEDGWTKVTRNQRRVRNESDVQDRRHGENSFPGGKSKITDFDKVMKASASSFFFTNFPETWDSSALWKMFSRYGNVVDV
ncbi:nucleotide-binding alpha-beta plait domain-containing protein, partial [Tanacetum coccineum]